MDSTFAPNSVNGELWSLELHWNEGPVVSSVEITSSGSLFAAIQEGLIELQLIKPWSYSEHKSYPEKFKPVVRTLLMCVRKGMHLDPLEGTTVQDLPMHAVGRVVQKLAASYKSYLPPCPMWPRVVKC